VVRSRYLELPCDGCLADEAHQPRTRFSSELHLATRDGFEFCRPRSFRWKRATASPQSLLSERAEPRARILQPQPPVQRVLQLCVAVWEWAALRKRRHWGRRQADRQLAMEWERPGCGRIPLHAAGWLQYFGYR